jgi:hypothetical protein
MVKLKLHPAQVKMQVAKTANVKRDWEKLFFMALPGKRGSILDMIRIRYD